MNLLMVTGVLFMIVSAMPWSWNWLGPCVLTLFIGAFLSNVDIVKRPRMKGIKTVSLVSCCFIALCLLVAGMLQRRTPELQTSSQEIIYVIGDSISAGLDGETTWPTILETNSDYNVVNLAHAGARVPEALLQSEHIADDNGIVVVEIGGNDILNFVERDAFSQSLRLLLESLTNKGLRVVMFEIPLPPFGNAYGRAQRRWADKYGVKIIPRHVLADLFRQPGTTTDGLHLSNEGHHLLAEKVSNILSLQMKMIEE